MGESEEAIHLAAFNAKQLCNSMPNHMGTDPAVEQSNVVPGDRIAKIIKRYAGLLFTEGRRRPVAGYISNQPAKKSKNA